VKISEESWKEVGGGLRSYQELKFVDCDVVTVKVRIQ
jgi:hypothetical protein